ncbi:MAG: hypothetical protein M0C28_22115 [Candidatus Moduliflexus flocculans]|nr:hypothetical protein [Candidatus Moduliflexus flocculans]
MFQGLTQRAQKVLSVLAQEEAKGLPRGPRSSRACAAGHPAGGGGDRVSRPAEPEDRHHGDPHRARKRRRPAGRADSCWAMFPCPAA